MACVATGCTSRMEVLKDNNQRISFHRMNNLTMDAENQTFILSLEDMDIDLLPNYFKKKDKAMPIWSTTNLDSRQGSFYEFQVLAGRDDDDKAKEIKMVPCHICNIDIPLFYLKEHRNSSKHKICTQIADLALERSKRQMYEHFECETKNSNSTYYCESCALAINVIEKEIHEKTREHSNSMRYDTLLNELLMLYNENTIEGLKLDCRNTVNKVDASTNTEIYEDIEAPEMREYIQEICTNKTDYSIIAMDENSIDININRKRVKVSVDNFHGLFLMGEKVLCMLCATEVTDEKTHRSSKGHVEKVMAPLKNEHCIREIGSYKHCVICNKYVDSYHFNDAEHRLQLNNAITNESEDLIQPQNYCETCKMILPIGQTPDSIAHINGADHRQYLWQANPNLHHHLKKTEDPTIAECRICYLPVKNKDMHLESKIHMTRYKALLELNKITKIDDLFIFCEVCCNRMLGYKELTHIGGKKHLKSLEEYKTGRISDSLFSQELDRQKYVKIDLLETEHEYLLNTDGVLNFVIDESVGETDEETSMIYNLLTEESEESNLLNLKVTDGNLIMILTNTDDHLDDIKDVIKRKNNSITTKSPADLTKVYYLMEKTNKLDILLCKVCQITVPNTVDDINEHNKSSEHNQSFFKCIDIAMILVKKFKNEENKETAECDSGIQIDSNTSCANSESKAPGSNPQSSSHSEISMPSCSFITPLSGSSSESNPHGSNSQLNRPPTSELNLFGSNSQLNRPSSSQSNLSDSNSQLNRPSSSESYLVPCSNLPSSSKVTIESNVEGLTVKNGREDNIFCDICLISVPNEDACLKRHYEGSAHKYHAQNSLQINSIVGLATHSYHLLTKTQNPKELLCNACNVKVPNLHRNTSEHLQGANHEINYNAMLEKNKLTKVDALTFFCGYCNINVVFSKIIDHITKGYHSLFVKSDIKFQHVVKSVEKPINVNQTVQKPFHICVICNVKVPNSDFDINIHEKGRPHLENMKLRIQKLENTSNQSQDALKQNYQMELKKTGVLFCKVCKVDVSNGNSCVKIHLNGGPHKNEYNKLLAVHKITKVGSKLHCQNCKVFLKLSTELTHIENMNHLVNTLANNGLVELGGNNSASSASQALPTRRTRSRKNKNN